MNIIKKTKFLAVALGIIILILSMFTVAGLTVFAENEEKSNTTSVTETVETEEEENNVIGDKAMAAALAVGIAGCGGGIGMGIAIGKSAEGISRQPEASGKISSTMMLGMVFIETLIIYALVIAILVIFVL